MINIFYLRVYLFKICHFVCLCTQRHYKFSERYNPSFYSPFRYVLFLLVMSGFLHVKTGMSLRKFGFSRNRTTNKRPHESDDSDCDSNNNGKDAKYDKKRIRDFQSHWRDDRHWLMYNEDTRTMYCTFCQSFPAVADKSNALTRNS
jgi:hypothetical protein